MRHAGRLVAPLTLLALVAGTAVAAPSPLAAALARVSSPIAVADGKLAGKGADVLRPAITAANFVMLGEDHGIAQIPALGAALCGELAPVGFHHLALEVGPSVAPQLAAFAAAPDGAARTAAFVQRYPETIAFYDWREEGEMLAACAKAMTAAPLDIWGVDQELMGATGFVLQQILDSHPGPIARAAVEGLVKGAAAARTAAAKTGDYGALFLLAAPQPTLDAATAALAKDASPEAQRLFASLLESRAIYLGQSGPAPYLSNRRRARLMKRTFLDDLSAAAKTDKAFPKVLLKLGAWHLYRGFNPLHSSELGNLVGEAAEGHGVEAVNILVLGQHGQQLRPSGVGRAPHAVAFDLLHDKDSELRFLAPLFAARAAKGWTLFELRALRPALAKLGRLDPELERVILGYDFVVVIPDPQPAHASPR